MTCLSRFSMHALRRQLSFMSLNGDEVKRTPSKSMSHSPGHSDVSIFSLDEQSVLDDDRATLASFLDEQYVCQNLISGPISNIIKQPPQIDRKEWILSHGNLGLLSLIIPALELFHLLNTYYEVLSSSCRPTNCGMFTFGYTSILCWDHTFFRSSTLSWSKEFVDGLQAGDSVKDIIKRVEMKRQSASTFIDLALSWIDQHLEDITSKKGSLESIDLPAFLRIMRQIFALYYFITAHFYCPAHFQQAVDDDHVSHLNTLYIHIVALATEFSLIAPSDLSVMAIFTEKVYQGMK